MSNRGKHRRPGAPGLPGAGRPPRERPIALTEVTPDGITPSVNGVMISTARTIKLVLEDGRKLTIWK